MHGDHIRERSKSSTSAGVDGTFFADLGPMAPRNSILLTIVVVALGLTGCKSLGGVASGVGKATVLAARAVAPAARVMGKVAVPVAHATAKVLERTAPVARDMSKLARNVTVDTLNAGVLVGQNLEAADVYSDDEGYYDSYAVIGDDSLTLTLEGELSPEAEPMEPTPPSFFELVNLYKESLRSCLIRRGSWLTLYFFVEMDGSVSVTEVLEGKSSRDASNCVLKNAAIMQFPPEQWTHGLLIRIESRN